MMSWKREADLGQWAAAPLMRLGFEAAGRVLRAGGLVITLNPALHVFILLLLCCRDLVLLRFLLRFLLLCLRWAWFLTWCCSGCCSGSRGGKSRHLPIHGCRAGGALTGEAGKVTGGAVGTTVQVVVTADRLLYQNDNKATFSPEPSASSCISHSLVYNKEGN